MSHRCCPALISRRVSALLPLLHTVQIQPYQLLLQSPRAAPPWEIVPPTNRGLILDLVGLPLPTIAMVLDDLLRRPSTAPVLLLVPQTAHGLHQLIAGSSVCCAVLPTTAAPAQIAQQLQPEPAAVFMPHQRWVGLPAPVPPHVDVCFIRLLATLSHVTCMRDAATRLFIHRATAYRVLGRNAARLAIEIVPHRKRRTHQWLALLSTALTNESRQPVLR